MATAAAARPAPDEFAPYHNTYISLVPDGDIAAILARQIADTLSLISEIGEAGGDYRYAPDKWSVRQAVGHMIDTERVFTYRALCFARGDEGPFPSFDQDQYVRQAPFEAATLGRLAAELDIVRQATLCLFRGLRADDWSRAGVASDHRITVRAIAFIVAGHELHHQRILASRYLAGLRAAQ
jgi:hypothetical protein